METMLIVVTIAALALAVAMAALAWRLLRADRRRADARADALFALATSEDEAVPAADPIGGPDLLRPRPEHVDVKRPAPAGHDHVVAWDQAPSLKPPAPAFHAPSDSGGPLHRTLDTAAGMFGATEEHGAPPRRWLVLAGVVTVMAAIVGTVYVVHVSTASATHEPVQSTAAAPAQGQPRPLELLSLRHTVDADGSFTVTGLVQNPFDGRVVRKAVAVVYLFDRDGNYFASGKASLDFTSLQPGDESPFVVHVTNVSRVSRYRVGFRSEEGGVIAHVDRRGQLPGGTSGDAIEPRATVPATRRSEG